MHVNFSGMSNRSALGRIVRSPLNMLPRNLAVPVLQGRLKGKRWIIGSFTHGCWLGSYELEKQEIFSRVAKRGDVVYDIGANVGFYTLLSSVLVGDTGCVYSFEPLPRNVGYLRRHISMNRIQNVIVIERAVSSLDGDAWLAIGDNAATGSLGRSGLPVLSITLDTLVLVSQARPPSVLKIDVEGAEVDVLSGGRATILRYRPTIFLATHGRAVHDKCCQFLTGLRYHLRSVTAVPVNRSDELIATPL